MKAGIQVLEQSSMFDDFDTENGIGHADDAEPYETDFVVVHADDAGKLDGEIADALRELGLDQWDGGSTAYDPDGSHMAPDGTITTRFAVIERSMQPGGVGKYT